MMAGGSVTVHLGSSGAGSCIGRARVATARAGGCRIRPTAADRTPSGLTLAGASPETADWSGGGPRRASSTVSRLAGGFKLDIVAAPSLAARA